nr:MAG TPA: hypothetical protein [Caudoviricetes sp.]
MSFTTNSGRKAKTGMGALLQVVNFCVFVFGVALRRLFMFFRESPIYINRNL